jgi:hypothetical protein
MKTEINPGNAVLFLLQREYIRECRIENLKDEEGNFKTDEKGQVIEQAVHPLKLSFAEWLQKNNLIVQRSQIFTPDKNIVKPLKLV